MPKGLQGHYRIAQLDGPRSSDEFGLELQEIAHCLADCLMRGQDFLARTPPATVAAAALTILAPYVKGASRELVKTVGEVALEKAKRLRRWLRDRFPGDPVAAKDFSRFEGESIKHALLACPILSSEICCHICSPEQAVDHWKVGVPVKLQYPKVIQSIMSFKPDRALQLNLEERDQYCPRFSAN
jgi:hypothetical protein